VEWWTCNAFCRCILEAAYELHDTVFFQNLGTVLLYAVIVSARFVFYTRTCLLLWARWLGNSELWCVQRYIIRSRVVIAVKLWVFLVHTARWTIRVFVPSGHKTRHVRWNYCMILSPTWSDQSSYLHFQVYKCFQLNYFISVKINFFQMFIADLHANNGIGKAFTAQPLVRCNSFPFPGE